MSSAGKPVALVTGSATGVGAATVLQLARRGWNVVVNFSRSQPDAHRTAEACRAAGADALLLQGDVSRDAECRRLVQQTLAQWGRIDALVNNAGTSVFGDEAKWEALDEAVFQRILGVNTIGTFQMVRACVPYLKAVGGCIVNVSSVAGALGIGSSVPYIASKGAMNAMTLHLARTLAPDVRVNAVCPGLITSRWFAKGIGEDAAKAVQDAYVKGVPLGKASSPEDVADAIVWLITSAKTVTGELLMLDSGTHLGGR
ncbi:SDR family NAD(P)-dependent oxidoreductase [Ramlibacter humi]|uniref:SDR family oxidoreductase n=1 Tax=Ramlibacter humi TaxID=2530451 RepID=A0A4Z0BDZ6_9BURK|nr:SDR family oxidoreductase [Ramlibacter humi]TFY96693.1 SDR family oxidoreductase [Ramlibacter humi]